MKPADFNEIDSYKYLTRKPFIYFKENIRDNYLTNTLRGGLGLALHFKENEYFNVINQNNLEGNILNTLFKEYREGELKFISFNAKKARGLLAKFVINNRIASKNDLKDFNLDNYKFDMSLSDESTFVFTR